MSLFKHRELYRKFIAANPGADQLVLHAYNSVVSSDSTTNGTGWVTVPFDTEVYVRENFSYSFSSGQIRLSTPGTYLILVQISTAGISSGSRSNSKAVLRVDSVDQSGTNVWFYNRGVTQGQSSGSTSTVVDHTGPGNMSVECRFTRVSGASPINVPAEAARIQIFRIND